MGPQLSLFFENEKAALIQQINAEFEKVGVLIASVLCNLSLMSRLSSCGFDSELVILSFTACWRETTESNQGPVKQK